MALAAAVLVLAALAFSTPGDSAWLPGCIFYKLTGLYCPGCGTTRMLFYLVHGHPIQAFRSNPLTLLVLPIVLYSLIRNSFALKLPALPTICAPWVAAFAVAVILFTVARNIPAEPFCKLAPGGLSRTSALDFRPRHSVQTNSVILRGCDSFVSLLVWS
jgi:hypothetical protein